MIRHIILLKLKPDADVVRIETELAALQDKIPGVISFESGAVLAGREARTQGYNWGFTMGFASKSALVDVYLPHPEHQTVVGFIKTQVQSDDWLESVLAFDYEVK